MIVIALVGKIGFYLFAYSAVNRHLEQVAARVVNEVRSIGCPIGSLNMILKYFDDSSVGRSNIHGFKRALKIQKNAFWLFEFDL